MPSRVEIVDWMRYLTPELPGCPKPIIWQHLLESIRNFCDQTTAWREDLDQINIKEDITEYDLDAPSYGEIIFPVRVGIYEVGEEPTYPEDNMEAPWWDYRREDKCVLTLIHAPTADITNGLNVRVALRPRVVHYENRTTENATICCRFFSDWHMPIASGVLMKLLKQKNKPWTDPDEARYHRSDYWDGVRKAAVDTNRNHMRRTIQARAKFPFV